MQTSWCRLFLASKKLLRLKLFYNFQTLAKTFSVDMDCENTILGQLFLESDRIVLNLTNLLFQKRVKTFDFVGREIPSKNWRMPGTLKTFLLVHTDDVSAILVDRSRGELVSIPKETKKHFVPKTLVLDHEEAWHSVLTPSGIVVQTRGKKPDDDCITLYDMTLESPPPNNRETESESD